MSSSSESQEEALATWQRVAPRTAELWAEKVEAMDRILSRSRLQVDDPDIQGLFDDIKVGYEQLYRHVPAMEKGLGAGLPETPGGLAATTATHSWEPCASAALR